MQKKACTFCPWWVYNLCCRSLNSFLHRSNQSHCGNDIPHLKIFYLYRLDPPSRRHSARPPPPGHLAGETRRLTGRIGHVLHGLDSGPRRLQATGLRHGDARAQRGGDGGQAGGHGGSGHAQVSLIWIYSIRMVSIVLSQLLVAFYARTYLRYSTVHSLFNESSVRSLISFL